MTPRKTKGLGKGLPSMFGVKSVADVLEPKTPNGDVQKLPLAKLHPGKYQARKILSEESIQELAHSIQEKGIINPIVVRKVEENSYEILAGERRFRAATLIGLKEVPVSILEVGDEDALIIGLIENLQREDLNVIDAAWGVQRLIQEFNFSHEQAAQAVGRSRSAVSNLIRLLSLPEEIQTYLKNGELDMGHARALLPLEKVEQIELAEEIIKKGLSVRQVEALVEKIKKQKEEPETPAEEGEIILPDFTKFEKQLGKLYGTPVKLSANAKGKGKIVLNFANKEELMALLKKLNKK
ncbi:MAG: ParB/RepB/Spo0J family partition protein [Burkholderiales bacterium]|uniref:ParB/RepB/Spo0J family partition protein n=1 Tax=uncultured Turicimonas sp. TaxID=1918607 RepID=UPI001EB8DAF1|nr:ParB/RepB/Spo0J family partition protein [uncultured Turicimonas sp.]MBS4845139.1 ParB/RepB/Spo0J family partition protein [Burkholderiales bacterium]